jgi:hypothetical protein
VKVVKGDFLSAAVDRKGAPRLLLAAGNGVVKRDGTLVMGGGQRERVGRSLPASPEGLR